MDNKFSRFLKGTTLCAMVLAGFNSQGQPITNRIQKLSGNQAKISFNATNGATYAVKEVKGDMSSPFALWEYAAAPVTATSNSASVIITSTNDIGIYKTVRTDLPVSGMPNAAITSPTNGFSTGNGFFVTGTASDDSQVLNVELLMDGKVYGSRDGTVNGPVRWQINPHILSRGPHTMKLRVSDDGNAAEEEQNISESAPVTFTNTASTVVSGFAPVHSSYLSIAGNTTFIGSPYTIRIGQTPMDTNGNVLINQPIQVIKTITGVASGGSINQNWNHDTDEGGFAPLDTSYTIEVLVQNDPQSAFAKLNLEGRLKNENPADVIMLTNSTSPVYINWAEHPGQPGPFILTTQKYKGLSGSIFYTRVITQLNNWQIYIQTAVDDGYLPAGAGNAGINVHIIDTDPDVSTLVNNLLEGRAIYFSGHGVLPRKQTTFWPLYIRDWYQGGFFLGEGVQTNYMSRATLRRTLGNQWSHNPSMGGIWNHHVGHAYWFVYSDSCYGEQLGVAEDFGMADGINFTSLGLHIRGGAVWKVKNKSYIASGGFEDCSRHFMGEWLQQNMFSGDYDTTIQEARDYVESVRPGKTANLVLKGQRTMSMMDLGN